MKAETADTVYRELLRRSSAAGLAYLREQLAAHEAKGCGLSAAGEALEVEWKAHRDGGRVMRAELGCGLFLVMCDDAEEGGYDVWLMTEPSPLVFMRLTGGETIAEAQANTLRKLPAPLELLAAYGAEVGGAWGGAGVRRGV